MSLARADVPIVSSAIAAAPTVLVMCVFIDIVL
jgi:hypothetical protein